MHFHHGGVWCATGYNRSIQVVVITIPGNILCINFDAGILCLESRDEVLHGVVSIIKMIPEFSQYLRRLQPEPQTNIAAASAATDSDFFIFSSALYRAFTAKWFPQHP